jgi:hypothetical protein
VFQAWPVAGAPCSRAEGADVAQRGLGAREQVGGGVGQRGEQGFEPPRRPSGWLRVSMCRQARAAS